MDLELTDKVAVVTGAGKGIGLAVTVALVDEGARVVAGSRTTETLDDLDGVTAGAVDLAAPDGPAKLIGRAIDEHGQVDVLVNNVGAVRMRLEGFGTSDEDFEWAMQMNFFIALRADARIRLAKREPPTAGPALLPIVHSEHVDHRAETLASTRTQERHLPKRESLLFIDRSSALPTN